MNSMFQIQNPLNSFQKWQIGSVAREMLLANPEIKAEVQEHIYPCIAPEGTLGNFIVYKREKYSKETVHQGVYADDCKLSFTAISDNYDDSTKIAELIDNTLSGDHMIENNKVKVRFTLTDSTEGWEDQKYFQVLLFDIK